MVFMVGGMDGGYLGLTMRIQKSISYVYNICLSPKTLVCYFQLVPIFGGGGGHGAFH